MASLLIGCRYGLGSPWRPAGGLRNACTGRWIAGRRIYEIEISHSLCDVERVELAAASVETVAETQRLSSEPSDITGLLIVITI